MKCKIRRKYQRKLNKIIRNINKNIEKDNLWNGRFVYFQHSGEFELFSDKSGGIFYVTIRAYDKKTGYYKDYYCDYAPYLDGFYGNFVFKVINDFIINNVKVWSMGENPRDDKTKYYNHIIDINKINKLPENYYQDIEHFRK